MGLTHVDYTQLQNAFQAVRDKLGELHGIDETLAVCHRVDQLNAAANEDEARHPDTAPAGPGYRPYETETLTIGSTYPFTIDQLIHVRVLDQGRALLRSIPAVVSAATAWGVDQMIGTTVRTQPVVDADPARLETLANSYASVVVDPISNISGDFCHFGHYWNWEGDAARAFDQQFYSQFPAVRDNQAMVAQTLSTASAILSTYVDLGQQSLLALLKALAKGLDEQLRQRHDAHQSTEPSAADWLNLAFVITGIVAGVATGGAAGALASASSVFAFAATKADGAHQQETVQAQYAHEFVAYADKHSTELMTQVSTALERLDSEIVEPKRRQIAKDVALGTFYPPRLPLDSFERGFDHMHPVAG